MEFASKLEELKLTRDEMSRLGEALKDDTFRELLREYAEEISSPESRKKYEEEIRQLEEQRGVRARFLHPEPHHVLKTRDARGKLFINICSDPLIDKPSSEAATDRRGTPGRRWRVPYSLTPARSDRDAAGNACVTHDVIFHPDALRLAGDSRRFMKLLHSTALGGLEDSFGLELEKNNIKQLKMKYKGVPQAALIRRPLPGHQQNTCEDLLSFPYPDSNQSQPEPVQTHTEPEPVQTHTEDSRSSSQQPLVPEYSVKYRSVVDLQDYRSSRDSGPGPRPSHIIISVELPLLRSAGDAELSVEQRRLVLEARSPAYKLDLLLSYPVEEDKGHAEFNKTNRQLTVTLPVRPATSAGSQQIGSDEMKSSEEDEDQNTQEEDPEPSGATEPPQTLSDPAVTWTEADTSLRRSSTRQTHEPADGGQEVSGAPEESEPNTASEASPVKEDPSSPQDAEEPKTRRSSEDHESAAERLLEEPDRREVCFLNSVWCELD